MVYGRYNYSYWDQLIAAGPHPVEIYIEIYVDFLHITKFNYVLCMHNYLSICLYVM